MATLKYYARLYFLIESQYIKARMHYRVDFIISTIGMVFTSIATVFVFRVLFDSIPDLLGWSFDEIVFLYAFYLLAVCPLQLFFDHIWQLRFHLAEGTFIKYYFRPLNMMFYYMSEIVDIKGFTQVALGIALMIYASSRLGLAWPPLRLLLLLAALFSSSLVAISILVIAASAAFWIIGSYPVLALALKIRDFAPYPTTIFDGIFRLVFTYLVPIGFVAFYPAQLFLRPEQVPLLTYLSPLVGIGFFALAYWVWSKGVNVYSGTGS
ncbi:MAG: ABC-2 family transporter protein [Thermoflexales bacterium]|nr:ABC-2 family transporter protein [Thermoflexales bacterium]